MKKKDQINEDKFQIPQEENNDTTPIDSKVSNINETHDKSISQVSVESDDLTNEDTNKLFESNKNNKNNIPTPPQKTKDMETNYSEDTTKDEDETSTVHMEEEKMNLMLAKRTLMIREKYTSMIYVPNQVGNHYNVTVFMAATTSLHYP